MNTKHMDKYNELFSPYVNYYGPYTYVYIYS